MKNRPINAGSFFCKFFKLCGGVFWGARLFFRVFTFRFLTIHKRFSEEQKTGVLSHFAAFIAILTGFRGGKKFFLGSCAARIWTQEAAGNGAAILGPSAGLHAESGIKNGIQKVIIRINKGFAAINRLIQIQLFRGSLFLAAAICANFLIGGGRGYARVAGLSRIIYIPSGKFLAYRLFRKCARMNERR